jgi:hypothetical protein
VLSVSAYQPSQPVIAAQVAPEMSVVDDVFPLSSSASSAAPSVIPVYGVNPSPTSTNGPTTTITCVLCLRICAMA